MAKIWSMAGAVLTISDLVATVSLDVSVLAGGDGIQREVLWAHSCEMSDPAQWLGPHELLMTVGLCVPHDSEEQVRFVARIDEAGLAGLMIGDHEPAPPQSAAMRAEADSRHLPILLVGAHTPYAVIARHVAAANSSAQTLQVLKLSKLYHLAAYADEKVDVLVKDLVALLGVGLSVEDHVTGLTIVSADHTTRSASELDQRRYPLRGAHPAELVVSEYRGEELDSFLLIHLMKVLEVAVDRVLNAADRRADVSARLMLSLLNGAVPPETGRFLGPHLPSQGFQLLALPASDGPSASRAVAAQRLPVLVGAGRTCHLALAPVAVIPSLRSLMKSLSTRIGASSVFTDYVDTRIAAGEAAKVLAAAQRTNNFWTEFEGVTISVLTRSHREASEIVTGVLGRLADTSARSQTLRETLFSYLDHDRSWKETAADLGIHRQTLSYRLTKIEEATGLSLSKSSDLSAFWIAYQAWETTNN